MEGQKGRRYIYPTEPAPNQPNLIKKQEKTNNPPLSGSCQSCRPPKGERAPQSQPGRPFGKERHPRGARTRLPPGDSAPPEARRPRPPSPLHLPESPESPGPSEPPSQGPEAPRAYPEAAPGQTSFPLEDRHLSGLTTGREYLNKSS